jgi:hypothetical protein
VDAAIGLTHLDKNQTIPPCWLDGYAGPSPDKLLVLRNGILDLDTGKLLAHTDMLFTRNALAFDFDPAAPAPQRFLKFLDEIWPDQADRDCHTALQQAFGYLLAPDTSHQKIFVVVGPPRCGKGTVGRLLGQLLGKSNICSPTFSSMGTPFGKQCMIGKGPILSERQRAPSQMAVHSFAHKDMCLSLCAPVIRDSYPRCRSWRSGFFFARSGMRPEEKEPN